MIIKIFKVSEQAMYTFKNKSELRRYILNVMHRLPPNNITVKELVKYLPKEDYCLVKMGIKGGMLV